MKHADLSTTIALAMVLLLAFGFLASCVPSNAVELNPITRCVDFEQQPLGKTYNLTDIFIDSDAQIAVLPLLRSNTWVSDGKGADVVPATHAGSGQEVFTNNASLGFSAGSFQCLTLRFYQSGGEANLIINKTVKSFPDVVGSTVGGVKVSVDWDAGSSWSGLLTLHGPFQNFSIQDAIKSSVNTPGNSPGVLIGIAPGFSFPVDRWISFAIGGKELWIDQVCPCE